MVCLNTNSVGTLVNDTLGLSGLKVGRTGYALDTLTGNSIEQLQNLHDAYMEQAQSLGTGPAARRMNQALAGGFGMPSPMSVMANTGALCGGCYAGGPTHWVDLGPASTPAGWLGKLFEPQRRMAACFERALRQHSALRMQFESLIGGRIVDFGSPDEGRVKIQRFAPGFMPNLVKLGPSAGHLFDQVGQMSATALGLFGSGALGLSGGNPFVGFVAGGLARASGFDPGAFRGANHGSQGMAGQGWSAVDNGGPLGGRGHGSWTPFAMPGDVNKTNPNYETAHQAKGAAILADPSLTVEDQVVLLLMLIMKKADDDIKRQAQYVNSIQQQQAARGSEAGGGLGGFFGNLFGGGILGGLFGGGRIAQAGGVNKQSGGNDAPSIDVETMKLKRMIDKRGQMFDMLRQIIDKYNQTAKSMIDSITR